MEPIIIRDEDGKRLPRKDKNKLKAAFGPKAYVAWIKIKTKKITYYSGYSGDISELFSNGAQTVASGIYSGDGRGVSFGTYSAGNYSHAEGVESIPAETFNSDVTIYSGSTDISELIRSDKIFGVDVGELKGILND